MSTKYQRHLGSIYEFETAKAYLSNNGDIGATISPYKELSSVSGQVLDQNQQPVPNASVSIYYLNACNTFSKTVVTDNDGMYQLGSVPAGVKAEILAVSPTNSVQRQTHVVSFNRSEDPNVNRFNFVVEK